jgi:methylmalonyl-CoA carboxyltransferase small subunit
MQLKVTVNGVAYEVEVEVEEEARPTLGAIFMTGGSFTPTHVQTPGATSSGVQAPLSGTVARVLVEEGQEIEEGDVVVVLEAMKMELPLRALGEGIVRAVRCREGDLVQADATLIEFS